MGGALGLGALWRRRQRQEAPAAVGPGPDPAEELRARLAESRAAEPDAPAEGDRPTGQEPAAPDPETRRRDLHERARASIDELR